MGPSPPPSLPASSSLGPQASAFEKLAGDCTFVLFLDCPLATCEQRLMQRAEAAGNTKESVESIRRRFETFQHHSMPLIESYQRKKKLFKVIRASGRRRGCPSRTTVWIWGGPG